MKKILFVFSTMLLALCPLGAQRLVILHTNDTHSHLEPFGEDLRGGVIERAAFIDSVRAAMGPDRVLLLDAGDFSQGTSYFSIGEGRFEDAALAAMDYDVTALGNHEFDNGLEALARRLSARKVPAVCANYDFEGTPLESFVKPWVIISRGGLKIGVIGALPYLGDVVDADIARQLRMSPDTYGTLDAHAHRLKKKGCDLVVVLSHMGFSEDPNDAIQLSDLSFAASSTAVDIVIGGHSHTDLKAAKMVRNSSGRDVMVVTDKCWGEYVGVITVE